VEREKLFDSALALLSAITKSVFIVKAMLAFDVNKRKRIRLQERITVDMWNNANLGVGASLQDATQRCAIFRWVAPDAMISITVV
jgi:hypothetical protein